MDVEFTEYLPRIVDAELRASLDAAGAVLIEGPRACGKTETARRVAASEVRLDVDATALATARLDPSLVLQGPVPRLIDEWQLEKDIWNHVRRAVDDRRAPGQFILTGSAVPPDDATRHVGAGRILRLRMRPMSLFEAGASTGAVSLSRILDGEVPRAAEANLTIPGIADLIARGGWPANLRPDVAGAQRAVRGYLNDVARVDIRRVDGVRRDPTIVARLLRSLARNVATAAPATVLLADVNGGDVVVRDQETIGAYLDALARLMVTEDLPAWSPSLRSRTRLRLSPVRHFADPSLALAAMRANPARLLRDVQWMGLLFESLVIRDLRVFAQAFDADVYHYRDGSGLEADAILELGDGRWAAVEVKLGVRDIDVAAANLVRLRDRIDTAAVGECAAMIVITGTGYSYRRQDGVAVVAVGSLGP